MAEQPNKDSKDASLAMRLLRMIWERRIYVARSVYAVGHTLGWLYQKFPLPRHIKDITTELTFHAIEHFIVQSNAYQDWLHRRVGLTRLHGLFSRKSPPDAPALSVKAPTADQWQALIHQHRSKTPPAANAPVIAVIIPVYKGYDETLRCIYSVLDAECNTAFTLTLINDASPDYKLVEKLRQLQEQGLFELVTHESNQGFVKSVNHGMQRHENQDVLLLNADTQVYDGWLDRMHRALHANEETASVTPFSNHAELCSYPRVFHANTAALELDYAALDQLAARQNHALAPELPTAVGFCMMIKRAALEQIGYFDEDTFGRGYGEENDWCLRAADAHWRHVLAADTFVRHTGNVSFEGSKDRLLRRSLRKLNARHPHYRKLVRSFREDDPLQPYRQQLDIARLQRLGGDHGFLMISHNAGGGTERHISDMVTRLAADGITAYRLSPDPEHASRIRLWHQDAPNCPNLIFDMDDDQVVLVSCLRALGITHLHLHHLIGFAPRMLNLVDMLARALTVPYDVTIHDYYFICPSINLIYDSGVYDGDPDIEQSEKWARHHPTPAGRTPIWQWRHQHQQLLEAARSIYAPSADCALRIQRYFPNIALAVRPHPESLQPAPDLFIPHIAGRPLDIAVIGHLTRHKGSEQILKLAQDAKERQLPIHFHIFGDAENAAALSKTGHATVHGAYQESDIYTLLAAQECHLSLTASIWPETYTYTLTIALNAGLYPVCFDLGAPSERIRNAGWGTILSLDYMLDAEGMNNALLALETAAPPANLRSAITHNYQDFTREYYGISPEHTAAA